MDRPDPLPVLRTLCTLAAFLLPLLHACAPSLPPPAPTHVAPLGGTPTVAPSSVPTGASPLCGPPETARCTELAVSMWERSGPSASLPLLSEACTSGSSHACLFLGRLLLAGRGVTHDESKALELLLRACEQNLLQACKALQTHLASRERAGQSRPEPLTSKRFSAELDCLQGKAMACNSLGHSFAEATQGYPRDPVRAVRYFDRGCALGEPLLCANLGIMVAAGRGIGANPERARQLFDESCRAGEGTGCGALARLYLDGRSVTKDLRRALELYERGCSLGTGNVCASLGNLHYYGDKGFPRDFPRAATAFRKGCDVGSDLACANLGLSYDYGDGIGRDPVKARELYQRACGNHQAYGCIRIDMTNDRQRGVPHDPTRAAVVYRSRCDARSGPACAALGILYDDAKGVPHDDDRKTQLLRQACQLGYHKACEYLQEAGVAVTPP